MNEKKEFVAVSNHFIIPQDGNVLIKATIPKIPTMAMLSKSKNVDYSFDDIEIIGTSVDKFNIGDKVIVASHIYENLSYRVEVKYNHKSFTAVQDYLQSMTDKEYKEFLKANPRVRIEELFIIPFHDVIAKIDTTKKVIESTALLFSNSIIGKA